MTVLRIMRPPSAPELTVDARGFLVALIHDLQIEVPAPESEAKGGVVGAAAKIYRIKIPQAEVALSYQVDSASDKATQLHAKVQDFSPGTNAEVLAIADDEAKAVPLSRFSAAVVLGAIGGRLRTLPIDVGTRPAQASGLLDPLDLAARPQRLGPRGSVAERRCAASIHSNSARGARPAGASVNRPRPSPCPLFRRRRDSTERCRFSRRSAQPRSPAAVEQVGEAKYEARQDLAAVERLIRADED